MSFLFFFFFAMEVHVGNIQGVKVYPRPPSSSCEFQYLLRLLWYLFTRWQILEGILCSVRRMPARASLLSQQRTMNCLKCAFSPQSQVSQGSKVWQPLAHNTHIHMHTHTHTHTRTHTRGHTHTHIHTRIHTRT